MIFALAPDEIAFRDEVRCFLDRALTDDLRIGARRTAGIFSDHEIGTRWHRILAAHGWSVPRWPVAHGGTGWSPIEHYIFELELAAADAPPRSPIGLGMAAPVIIAFGTPEQQERWLPGIRSGDDYWCQGYSEPGAGSDLAALQCRAERVRNADGDAYVLNGTKIWTTHAHHANRMFCLVRTARGGKPQQGISFLCFDMNTPGITVQPIRCISGDHEFNQVFFADVRVPDSALVGEENDGWTIAKYLLQHERGAAWAPLIRARWGRLRRSLAEAFSGEDRESAEHVALGLDLADAHCRIDALQAFEIAALRAELRGEPPGVTPSIGKILGTELRQRLTELHAEIAGPATAIRVPMEVASADALAVSEDAVFAMSSYLNDRAASIYAGTNEVQRNLVATHLLRR